MRSILKVNGGWQDPNGGKVYPFVAGTFTEDDQAVYATGPYGTEIIKKHLVDQAFACNDGVQLQDTDLIKVLN